MDNVQSNNIQKSILNVGQGTGYFPKSVDSFGMRSQIVLPVLPIE
jgi:hypothetical protein